MGDRWLGQTCSEFVGMHGRKKEVLCWNKLLEVMPWKELFDVQKIPKHCLLPNTGEYAMRCYFIHILHMYMYSVGWCVL